MIPVVHFVFLALAISAALFLKGFAKYAFGCLLIPLVYAWFTYSNIDESMESILRSCLPVAGAFFATILLVGRKWFFAVFLAALVFLVYPEETYHALYVRPAILFLDVVDPVIDTVKLDGEWILKRRFRGDDVYVITE